MPAVRKKKLRNSYVESQSTSNLPQAETPPSGKRAKHLSLLNLSVSSHEGGGSETSSPTSPLSVSVSPGSDSSSPGSPPQRPPLPTGYSSLGRRPKSALLTSGSNTRKTMQSPVSPQSKSPTSEPNYYSLDRASKPKRPAPLPQLSPIKRTAPAPPVIESVEINNNTVCEGLMSSEEIKNRMLQLLMLDPT